MTDSPQHDAAETIAVFGATGTQGGSVVEALLDSGARVRALARDPESEKASALADRGVEVVRADLDDPDSVRDALNGAAAFYFMTTPYGSGGIDAEVPQGRALAMAADEAGVPRIVFSSVGGAERDTGIPHFDTKREIERLLESRSARTTFVRPVFFMENLASTGPSVEDGEIVVRLPLPDEIKLQMVAVRDIGRVAAAALLDPSAVPGEIEIAGDERTGSEIAAAFQSQFDMPARYETLPISVLDDNADSQAMFRWFADTPAYEADIEATRAVDPELQDLPRWLADGGWSPEE